MIDHRKEPRAYYQTILRAMCNRWGIKFEHKETMPADIYCFPYSGTTIKFYAKTVVIDEALPSPDKPEKFEYLKNGYMLERIINRALFACYVHQLFKTVRKVPENVVFRTRRCGSLWQCDRNNGFEDVEIVVEYDAYQDDGIYACKIPVMHETIHLPFTGATKEDMKREIRRLIDSMTQQGDYVPLIMGRHGQWSRLKPYGLGVLVVTSARLRHSVEHESGLDLGFLQEDKQIIALVEQKKLVKK